MSDPIAIVAPATDVDIATERARILEARKREAHHAAAADDARVVIGQALLRIRPRWPERGPRAKGWGDFLESVGIESSTAWRYMEFAKRIADLSCGEQETQPDRLPTYAEVGLDNRARGDEGGDVPRGTRADPKLTGQDNPNSDENYTPLKYVVAAREVMGGIDLDPASCAAAQERIQAGAYFTKEDDGLTKEWFGRNWLNPPFSHPLGSQFVFKLIEEYLAGRVTQAVLLQNASTDTRWFHAAAKHGPLCLTDHRIGFENARGVPRDGNRYCQVFFYFGPNEAAFARIFSRFGSVGRLSRLER